jgi:hypothetical protein
MSPKAPKKKKNSQTHNKKPTGTPRAVRKSKPRSTTSLNTHKEESQLTLVSPQPSTIEVESMEPVDDANGASISRNNTFVELEESSMSAQRGRSTMNDAKSLDDLVREHVADIARAVTEQLQQSAMRLAQAIAISVQEEAQQRAFQAMKLKMQSVFGSGAILSDIDLARLPLVSAAEAKAQQLRLSTPAVRQATPAPKKHKGTVAEVTTTRKKRKGTKQSWTASCPVPGCKGTPIRPQRNFCSDHAKSLTDGQKNELRKAQKIALATGGV